MSFKDTPIRHKLMMIILLTTMAAVLLVFSVFFVHEFLTFRRATFQQLSTVGEVIAANSTAALAFDNQDDAKEILSALKAESHITAAALYDKTGKLFATYPAGVPDAWFPAVPENAGYHFQHLSLIGFQPVVQGGSRLGTLYLQLDTGFIMRQWFGRSLRIAVVAIAIALWMAYLISKALQKQISQPILSLAETAKAVSDHRDYSIRATKIGQDELGLLTDAFNEMLSQIQEQNQALSESEARVRAVVDSALSAVVVIDAQGKITDWNVRAERMFGWTHAEALGRELAETIIPPRYREAHRGGMKHFLASGEGPVLNRSITLSALRRDGDEFPVELSISPIKSGEVVTFCGFITDITERQRAESAMRQLAAIVESSDDAIIGKDLNSVITSWNNGAEKIFGYSAAEMVGNSIMQLIPADRHDEEKQILKKIRRGESAQHFETVRQAKDGRLIDVSVTVSPIKDSTGKVVGASKVARDITERKLTEKALRQSETRYQTIVESLAEGLVVSDLHGQVLHFNRAALDLHGFASLDECHRHLTEFADIFELSGMDGTVWPVDQWPLARVLRGENLRNLEARIRRVQTDWKRVFSYGGTLVHDAGGQPMIAVVTVNDITEREQAAERIRQLNVELEQRVVERTAQLQAANKELEAFSYSVSHDLRAPLRHVAGFVELLKNDAGPVLSEKSRRHLTTISTSAKRMGDLIDDLLAFSRVGRVEMQKSAVDLNSLVKETLADLQGETNGRNIVWKIDPLPDVQADRAMLRQVIINLLANAVKFTRTRDPAIIEIGCAPADSNEVIIVVRDNGAGFDPKYANKLFGVFQRLHSSSDFEGTGIGLANVQRIILRHGGRVWAEGAVDQGATFFFSIPKPTKGGVNEC